MSVNQGTPQAVYKVKYQNKINCARSEIFSRISILRELFQINHRDVRTSAKCLPAWERVAGSSIVSSRCVAFFKVFQIYLLKSAEGGYMVRICMLATKRRSLVQHI